MSDYMLTQYARLRAETIKPLDRPVRRLAWEARVSRRPRRLWRAR